MRTLLVAAAVALTPPVAAAQCDAARAAAAQAVEEVLSAPEFEAFAGVYRADDPAIWVRVEYGAPAPLPGTDATVLSVDAADGCAVAWSVEAVEPDQRADALRDAVRGPGRVMTHQPRTLTGVDPEAVKNALDLLFDAYNAYRDGT